MFSFLVVNCCLYGKQCTNYNALSLRGAKRRGNLLVQTRKNRCTKGEVRAKMIPSTSRCAFRYIIPGDCHGPKGPRNDTVTVTQVRSRYCAKQQFTFPSSYPFPPKKATPTDHSVGVLVSSSAISFNSFLSCLELRSSFSYISGRRSRVRRRDCFLRHRRTFSWLPDSKI